MLGWGGRHRCKSHYDGIWNYFRHIAVLTFPDSLLTDTTRGSPYMHEMDWWDWWCFSNTRNNDNLAKQTPAGITHNSSCTHHQFSTFFKNKSESTQINGNVSHISIYLSIYARLSWFLMGRKERWPATTLFSSFFFIARWISHHSRQSLLSISRQPHSSLPATASQMQSHENSTTAC